MMRWIVHLKYCLIISGEFDLDSKNDKSSKYHKGMFYFKDDDMTLNLVESEPIAELTIKIKKLADKLTAL